MKVIMQFIGLGVAIFAIFIATCSLKVSQKTRKDMFLPVLLVDYRGMSSEGIDILTVENRGQGIAQRIELQITGSPVKDSIGSIPVGEGRLAFNGRKAVITEEVPDTLLVISYYDLFGRKVVTTYQITRKHNYLTINEDFPDIKLPD